MDKVLLYHFENTVSYNLVLIIFLSFLFFSPQDIALVIQYWFHDADTYEEDPEDPHNEKDQGEKNQSIKKRKITDARQINVIHYSKLKLPARQFGFYIEKDCEGFLKDCLR